MSDLLILSHKLQGPYPHSSFSPTNTIANADGAQAGHLAEVNLEALELLSVQLNKLECKEVAAFAEALAPSCELVHSEGFDEFELETLRSLLQRNLPLLWDDALEAAAG